MNTKTIPKHNKRTGGNLPCPYYYGGFSGGSKAAFSLKIAPKHDTCYLLSVHRAVTANMGGFFYEGGTMPRMSKKLKNELAFFLNDRGRRSYNALCRKCQHPCKQSFRAVIVECPKYLSKRARKRKEGTG